MRDANPFLGVQIDRMPLQAAVGQALSAIDRTGSPVVFACANPHSLTVAQSDTLFRSALNNATLVVTDGVGISLMGRICGVPLGPRITGTDYFLAVLRALAQRKHGRVFFFGSTPKVLAAMGTRFKQDFPSLTCCGTLSPPFGSWSYEDNARMVHEINKSAPDVLWVGLSAPKQEKWVEENRQILDVPVIGSVGAVFDFYANTIPRAPLWMCKIGLEWIYRLLKEPRRMWKRTFVSAPKFLGLAISQHGVSGWTKTHQP